MPRWTPLQPPENALPPQEVRITHLTAEPWPDGRRVRVSIEMTPFLERPNVEVRLIDCEQQEVSSLSIIESIDDRMTFTMHIRRQQILNPYTLTASIEYPEIGAVHQQSASFEIDLNPPDN